MIKILEKHCLGKGNKGLLLLSLPTGFGKTHTILDFIFQHYDEFTERNSKIYFITNLKKNLPDEALKERFRQAGGLDEYKRHVLRIPSTSEHVVKKLPRLVDEGRVPVAFQTKAYKDLLQYAQYLEDEQLQGGGRLKEYSAALEKSVRTEREPAFRREAAKFLEDRFPHKKARLEAVANNPHYSWIGDLYPAAFTDERTVLFLSASKFFLKNTPVIEPSYYFSHRIPDDSLIFFDEFDATKETFLKMMIEDRARHGINLIDLFLTIRNALAGNEFPEALLKESECRRRAVEEKNKPWPKVAKIAESFKEKCDHIYKKYNLNLAVKSGEGFSGQRNFLFHDYRFHHVIQGGPVKIRPDYKSRINSLYLPSAANMEEGEDGAADVRLLLGDLTGLHSYVQNGVGYIADNYRHLKAEGGAADDLAPESSVRTVLTHFQIGREDTAVITERILENANRYKSPRATSDEAQEGFYDRGFRLYNIVDSEDHDTCSKLFAYGYDRTPEAFLAEICERAMVVGSSATAAIPSPLANYDLLYLESRLGSLFQRLDREELGRLKKTFDRITRGYGNLRILPDFICAEDKEDAQKLLTVLFDDEEAAKHWMEEFARPAPMKNEDGGEEAPDYILTRYARALAAWKRFYESDNCAAFLCLFTKLCKEGDSRFDLNLLRKAAAMLSRISQEQVKEMLVVLGGDDFDSQKEKILADLSSGKRRFVLTSYKTAGAGQNLQFLPPEGARLIATGDGDRLKATDFSGIYVDRPTNLLVNISKDDLTEEEIVEYIFQLEFLLESGAISPKAFRNKLRQAFAVLRGGRYKWTPEGDVNLYETASYAYCAIAWLMQAVGRVCRTGLKSPEILILADGRLKGMLSKYRLPEDVIPIREFEALMAAAGRDDVADERATELQNIASHRSNVFQHRVTSLLQRAESEGEWSEKDREAWIATREQVLRRPFYVSAEECPPRWERLYALMPTPATSYRYEQRNDYADVEVFFSNNHTGLAVSSEAARLEEVAAVPEFRRRFEKNEWPLYFPPSELLLLPPVFNNIYKGALGEVCGRCILEEVLGVPLFELDEGGFELFDYRTAGGIYVDFKLWSDRTATPAVPQLEKIRRKMEQAKAARMMAVNIFASPGVKFRPLKSADGLIIEIPFMCQNGRISEEALQFLKKQING